MLVVKTRIQAHEDLLMGNPQSGEEGVVSVVNRSTIEHAAYRKLGIVLQAVAVLVLGWLSYRNETKPPTVIIQQVPTATTPIQGPAKRSYLEPSDAAMSHTEKPQDARIPYLPPTQ